MLDISPQLLDISVLSVVKKKDVYGYELNNILVEILKISESTLYPVLRRLQLKGYLSTYDKQYNGRNRRYYYLTENGREQLNIYKQDWENYKNTLDKIIGGEFYNEND